MERAKQKLHSRRGASILLALFLMLVAAMVSAVIVSAAVTAANRVHSDRAEVQDSLSVSSAGKLMAQYLRDHSSYRTVSVVGDTAYFSEAEPPEGAACLKQLTDNASATHTLRVGALREETDNKLLVGGAVMTLTLAKDEKLSDGETEKYDLKGEISLADAAGSAQKLYLAATLTKTVAEVTLSDIVPVPTGEKDAEGNPITTDKPVSITKTTVTWTVGDTIRLANSGDRLWNESNAE